MKSDKMRDASYQEIDGAEFSRRNWGPHGGWYSKEKSTIIIEVLRSKGGDFAINEKCIRDLAALIKTRALLRAVFLLIEKDRSVVSDAEVETLIPRIAGLYSHPGEFGRYFWFTEDFIPVPSKRDTIALPW